MDRAPVDADGFRTEESLWRLTRDFKNPNGDNRVRYNLARAPVWKAGLRLVMETKSKTISGPKGTAEHVVCILSALRPSGRTALAGTIRNEALFNDLLTACERVEPSLRDFLSLAHVDAESVLRGLLKRGKVTMSDVQEAAR
jgi:hypothetical protein